MSLESRLLSLVQAIGADIKSLVTGKANTSHTHSDATTLASGFMSAADKTKLNGVATNANNYTLPTATATVKGGVELFSDTVQSVAAEVVTATAGRTYGIQLNSAGQAVVNVPWESSTGGGGSDVNFTTAYEALLLNAVQDFVGRVEFDTAKEALLNNAVQNFAGRVEFDTTKEALLNNAVQAQLGYGLSQNDFTNYYVSELDTLIANSGGGDPAAAFQKDILIDTEGYVSEPGLDKRLRTYAKDVGGLTLPGVIAPYGVNFGLQESLAFGCIALWNAVGNTSVPTRLGISVSKVGTATTANVALTNIHTATRRLEYAVTTASATAVAGLRQSKTQYALGNSANIYGGFHFVATFGPSRGVASGEARRFFAGMTSITAAPTDVQPSTWAANAIGVGADTGDVNWQIMHRAGTGAMTKIDTGFYKNDVDTSEMYTLSIFSPPQGGQRATVRFTRLSDGQFFERTITTNLPALTQLLAWQIWASVGGVSSVIGVSISSVYIKTKY